MPARILTAEGPGISARSHWGRNWQMTRQPPQKNDPRPGRKAAAPQDWRALAAIVLAVAAAFLYLGGWFSPGTLTPARFVDGFERVQGIHSGFRRNHAKGVAVSGFFESNGQGVRLSKAVVFRPGRVPVIGRFSLGGGDPYACRLARCSPRSGAFVPARRWRRVAHGHDQRAGVSVCHPAGFLRQVDCVPARPHDREARPGQNGGICRRSSRNRASRKNHRKPSAVIRLRQQPHSTV